MHSFPIRSPQRERIPEPSTFLTGWQRVGLVSILMVMMAVVSSCSQLPEPADTSGTSQDSNVTSDSQVDDPTAPPLTCDLPKGLCPSGLAMAAASIDPTPRSKFYQCTAFLVANDTVATNTHCLPEDLRTTGADCTGRIKFYFGHSADAPAETARCAKVLSASKIPDDRDAEFNLHPDIAFLKLQQPLTRKPFKLSRSGASNATSLTVYVVDPVATNRIRGIGRKRTCVARQASIVVPQYTYDYASVIAASCTILPGNSGSPALASDGTVRAVVHASRPVSSIDITSYKGYQLPARFDEMAFLTNISCAPTPAALALDPTAQVCTAPIPSRDELVRTIEHATQVDIERPFTSWYTGAPKMFNFELEESGTDAGRIAIPRPSCLVSPDQWTQENAQTLAVDSLNIDHDLVTISFATPVWGSWPALNSYEQVSIKPGTIDRPQTTITFDLAALRRKHYARITAQYVSQTGAITTPRAVNDLKICE